MSQSEANGPRRGFSLTELLVTLLCLGMAATLVLMMLPQLQGGGSNPRTRDGTQLMGIRQSFVVAAREYDGIMPLPGNAQWLPLTPAWQAHATPERGEEVVLRNTTANLYSMMIMANFFSPELAVSALDRNPVVTAKDDYDYDKYDPLKAIYWDDSFQADLEKASNVSYAHLLLHGERKSREWRESLNPNFAMFSSRGPKDGIGDPKSYTCDKEGRWQGNVVFNDNSTMWRTTMTKAGVVVKGEDGADKPDNIFAIDDGLAGRDIILTFTREMKADGPVIQHD